MKLGQIRSLSWMVGRDAYRLVALAAPFDNSGSSRILPCNSSVIFKSKRMGLVRVLWCAIFVLEERVHDLRG